MWVDGVLRSLRTRKYCFECSPFGSHNTRPLGVTVGKRRSTPPTEKRCTKCKATLPIDGFYKVKDRYGSECRKCFVQRGTETNRRTKLALVGKLGGKCHKCSYNKMPIILHFHHTDPSTKSFNISENIDWSIRKLLPEVGKCILLCPTCHAETHQEMMNGVLGQI